MSPSLQLGNCANEPTNVPVLSVLNLFNSKQTLGCGLGPSCSRRSQEWVSCGLFSFSLVPVFCKRYNKIIKVWPLWGCGIGGPPHFHNFLLPNSSTGRLLSLQNRKQTSRAHKMPGFHGSGIEPSPFLLNATAAHMSGKPLLLTHLTMFMSLSDVLSLTNSVPDAKSHSNESVWASKFFPSRIFVKIRPERKN